MIVYSTTLSTAAVIGDVVLLYYAGFSFRLTCARQSAKSALFSQHFLHLLYLQPWFIFLPSQVLSIHGTELCLDTMLNSFFLLFALIVFSSLKGDPSHKTLS